MRKHFSHGRAPARPLPRSIIMKPSRILSTALLSSCLIFACGAVTPAAAVDDGFVRLPGGSFLMGSPESERQRCADETRHEVRVAAFHVDPHEVTQADYEAVMGVNPSVDKGARRPVSNVTWLDAVRYCNALSVRRGLEPAYVVDGEAVTWKRAANGYRLLTEAEWEYAARAGTDSIFSVGSQVHSDLVNFEGSYPYLIEENYVTQHDPSVRPSRCRGHAINVDELAPNAFGLHHMHGNVSEWVFDYYGSYDLDDADNPAGPAHGKYRVARGGSYNDFGKHVRSAYRSAVNPIDPDPNTGFRICRSNAPMDRDVVTAAPERIAMPAPPRVLVACFSYSGNTRRAARHLSERLGCDYQDIAMAQPYRGNIYEVSQQDLNAGARPPLRGPMPDMSRYDVVLLGYPTWWATMPMPVLTFLEGADFSGKIVMPFSSHGGTIFGESVSDLAKAVPGAWVGVGFEFHYSGGRSLNRNLNDWLSAMGLTR